MGNIDGRPARKKRRMSIGVYMKEMTKTVEGRWIIRGRREYGIARSKSGIEIMKIELIIYWILYSPLHPRNFSV